MIYAIADIHGCYAEYRELLERINPAIGHIKLAELRPQHLNAFYKNLSDPGIANTGDKATAKADIPALLKEEHLTRAKTVTTHWFDDTASKRAVGTWEGSTEQ